MSHFCSLVCGSVFCACTRGDVLVHVVSRAKAGEQVCGLAWLPGWVLTQGSGLALLLGQQCSMLWFSGQNYLWGVLALCAVSASSVLPEAVCPQVKGTILGIVPVH